MDIRFLFLFYSNLLGSDANSIDIDTDLAETASAMGVKSFRFDAVFDGSASQSDVFSETIPLLQSALRGYNCTIFTYGQTGTGKTHTMLGHDIWSLASEVEETNENIDSLTMDEGNFSFLFFYLHFFVIYLFVYQILGARGIIPRAMQYLFSTPSSRNDELSLTLSYVEIYNESVFDLLNPPEDQSRNKGLEVREDGRGGIEVNGLSEVHVTTLHEVFTVLWDGAKNRNMATTNMNEHSSRSHTILIVKLLLNKGLTEPPSFFKSISSYSNFLLSHISPLILYTIGDKTLRSKLCLVDLAGSEKWKTHSISKFSEKRIRELTSINQSLSCLGNCISALLSPHRSHIPYRW